MQAVSSVAVSTRECHCLVKVGNVAAVAVALVSIDTCFMAVCQEL